jgi:hypothetical protein
MGVIEGIPVPGMHGGRRSAYENGIGDEALELGG